MTIAARGVVQEAALWTRTVTANARSARRGQRQAGSIQLLAGKAEILLRIRKVRLEPHRLREVLDRLRQAAGPRQGRAQVVVGGCKTGAQPDRPFVFVHRLFRPPLRPEPKPEVAVRVRVIGLNVQGGAEPGYCLVRPAHPDKGVAGSFKGFRVERLEPEGLLELRQRLRAAARGREGGGGGAGGLRVKGGQAERLGAMVDRLPQAPLPVERNREIVVGQCKIGLPSDRKS